MGPSTNTASPIVKGVVARNALANVARIRSVLLIGFVVSKVLEQRLTGPEFSAWAIGLQLGNIFALLDLGMQMTVSRFVAEARATANRDAVNATVSTAAALQGGVAMFGVIPLVGFAVLVPTVFANMPADVVDDARWCILAIGLANLLALPASAVAAYLLGSLRSEPIAVLTVAGRMLGGVLVLAASSMDASVAMMGVLTGACVAATAVAQVLYTRLRSPDLQIARKSVSIRRAKSLVAYSAPLAIWTASGFFVSGLDTTIVGTVAFASVPAFTIAAMGTGVLGAVHAAFLGPFLSVFAQLHGADDERGLRELLSRLTRWSAMIVAAVTTALIACAPWLLRAWVSHDVAVEATPLLRLLLIANAVRLLGAPFGSLLAATNEHRRVLMTPVAEAVVNVGASIVLGRMFGAVGVAFGTLAGAGTSLGLHVFRNMARVTRLRIDRREVVWRSTTVPFLCAVPVGATLLTGSDASLSAFLLAVIASSVSLVLLAGVAATAEDRRTVTARWRIRRAQA